jgi:3-oxoacyl-[acyl-carrier-protein] synthase II
MADAGVEPGDIDYVNAHATGTPQGDVEEAQAIAEIFGDRVPVSSVKGYIGHTLGAAGAVELIAALEMMRRNRIYPTLNLEKIDPACAGVDHVQKPRQADLDIILKNSFAFGGINAALVCRKAPGA